MEEIPNNLNPELRKFTYRDNINNRRVVFECDAGSIVEADKLYIEKTLTNPKTQPHIACSIETIEQKKILP